MTQENTVSTPSAETQNPAGDDAQLHQAQGGTESDKSSESKDAGDTQDLRDKTIAKLERRIGRKTSETYELRARLAALEQQLGSNGGQQGNNEGETAEPVRRGMSDEQRARAMADELRAGEKIADRAKAMLKAGEAFDGFRELSIEVSEEIPFLDEKGKPTQFIEALLEAENPAALMHHLGSNPDLVAEIAALSPTQQVRKLGRLEAEIARQAEKKVSSAPRPLTPVSGSQHGEPDPASDVSAWIAMRNKQARSR